MGEESRSFPISCSFNFSTQFMTGSDWSPNPPHIFILKYVEYNFILAFAPFPRVIEGSKKFDFRLGVVNTFLESKMTNYYYYFHNLILLSSNTPTIQ